MEQHMIDVQALEHCICNALAVLAALVAAKRAGKSHEVSKENRATLAGMKDDLGKMAEEHSPVPVVKIDGGLIIIPGESETKHADASVSEGPLEIK